jgi:hypothetical protein
VSETRNGVSGFTSGMLMQGVGMSSEVSEMWVSTSAQLKYDVLVGGEMR